MGRPPLGNKSTNVRISEEVKERIRELVGEKGMARFIREAVDEKLARDETAPKPKKR
jgi:predicted DNA-binding protein